MPELVNTRDDLVQSVHRFMKFPSHWRSAVGSNPMYFVHVAGETGHCFGLSKFCALKSIALPEYIHQRPGHGQRAWKRIRKILQQPWLPLDQVDEAVRLAFEAWFFGFFPGNHSLDGVRLISIPSSETPSEQAIASATPITPGQLRQELRRQAEIGKVGELIAYRYECDRLGRHGIEHPSHWVDHVSLHDVAAGYDILTHAAAEAPRYIEVKASTRDPNRFFITSHELATLRSHKDRAYLYLVLVTDAEAGRGYVSAVIQNPVKRLESDGTLEPIIYRAQVR